MPIKIKKSAVINSILTTFLLVAIVSCKGSRSSSSHSRSDKSNSHSNASHSQYADPKVDKVINTARTYLGTRYKYGGTSRNGIDCSGLVYSSFKQINIDLPRTSEAQSKAGKPVKLDELQPGDLVFFTDKKGHKKITHVGIVVEAKGKKDVKFIHASTKLGVVENDLYAEYYISIFIKAVRIF